METSEQECPADKVNVLESLGYTTGKIITGIARNLQKAGYETRGRDKKEVSEKNTVFEIYDRTRIQEGHPTYHIGTAEFDSYRKKVMVRVYGKNHLSQLESVMKASAKETGASIDILLEKDEPLVELGPNLSNSNRVNEFRKKFGGLFRREKRSEQDTIRILMQTGLADNENLARGIIQELLAKSADYGEALGGVAIKCVGLEKIGEDIYTLRFSKYEF